MRRTWTEQSRDEWVNRRTERRRRANRPDPRTPRDDSLEREQKNVRDALDELTTKAFSWELQKHPPQPYPAPFSGRLHLPLRYCGDDQERTVRFKQGDDLNMLVHRFYDEQPDPGFKGDNYVATVSISPRRHEFLGPAPFVAGYQFDEQSQTARIEWWDPYTGHKWIGRGKWKIELYFDDVVGGWVSRPRGDYDSTPDMQFYLGL